MQDKDIINIYNKGFRSGVNAMFNSLVKMRKNNLNKFPNTEIAMLCFFVEASELALEIAE